MVPFVVSVSAANQNYSLLIAVHIFSTGFMSSTCSLPSIVACRSFLVELMPCLGRTKCPFAVAVDSGRCLVRRSAVRPGKVRS